MFETLPDHAWCSSRISISVHVCNIPTSHAYAYTCVLRWYVVTTLSMSNPSVPSETAVIIYVMNTDGTLVCLRKLYLRPICMLIHVKSDGTLVRYKKCPLRHCSVFIYMHSSIYLISISIYLQC